MCVWQSNYNNVCVVGVACPVVIIGSHLYLIKSLSH